MFKHKLDFVNSLRLIAMMLMAISLVGLAEASETQLKQYCLGCHTPQSQQPLKLSRISHQRKTPEGWLMTIARMQVTHGLQISDEDRRSLVKYLADTQGLAPVESEPYRYILERRLNYQEQKKPELAEMCARCHSEARVGLQRRKEEEWKHLVNFHLGQWPSTEFSAMGRDRDWFGIATNEVVPYLAETFPFDSDAWAQWQQSDKPDVAGRWRLVGNMPGKGEFQGEMVLSLSSKDQYDLTLSGRFNNGERLKGEGSVLLYSGYEWRGTLNVNDLAYQQVFAVNENGSALTGRMFQTVHEELGFDVQGSKGEQSQVMVVSPAYIQAGETKELAIRGNHLKGEVKLPASLKVLSEVSRNNDEIVIKVTAKNINNVKKLSIAVGEANLDNAITVYQQIDAVKVEPSYAVARVGDGGGSQPKVKAVFEALAYAAGADGKAGTDDDIKIGIFPAKWHLEPFDEQAVKDEDLKFVGKINPETGVFTPAVAGPNPARKYGTNNVGRLSVKAIVGDQKQTVTGSGELIVTVQRWNNPPIR